MDLEFVLLFLCRDVICVVNIVIIVTLGIFPLGKLISVQEVVSQIKRYQNYLLPSGGGVTVTGGEPLLQLDFLIALFTELKALSIPTAIDTSGMFAITPKLETLIELTDLFLFDIKHIDREKCKDLVGLSNELELDFARYLSEKGKPMWIRQVLIPGITDNKEDLIKLRNFLRSLLTVEKVEILPYHGLGKYKWEKLGFSYELDGVPDATKKDVERAKEILEI